MRTFFFIVLAIFLGLWFHPFVGIGIIVWLRLRSSVAPFGLVPLIGFIFDVMYRSYQQIGFIYVPHYFLIGLVLGLVILVVRNRINFYET
ncbi:hypothetical protein CL684_00090 [Candidatus Campbellbacteria bacterium]|nr:hypothetical protein [Candidatus Campbellbacteria bacterium]|tara:strand:+ start:2660 stop:2929 length:270 start_codon:yes stop_codon:yes gene_type:complete